jgi:hypothetical protein
MKILLVALVVIAFGWDDPACPDAYPAPTEALCEIAPPMIGTVFDDVPIIELPIESGV